VKDKMLRCGIDFGMWMYEVKFIHTSPVFDHPSSQREEGKKLIFISA
jgi:hypothetical protein